MTAALIADLLIPELEIEYLLNLTKCLPELMSPENLSSYHVWSADDKTEFLNECSTFETQALKMIVISTRSRFSLMVYLVLK